MQKKLIALAIAGLSGAAFAQSNVTVYGVADGSFEFVNVKDGPDTPNYQRVNTAGSSIGFKGVESLGNGMAAVFQYESDVRFDQAGGFGASRDSYVALAGSFGTVALGNLTGPSRAFGEALDVNTNHDAATSNRAIIGKMGGLLQGLSITGNSDLTAVGTNGSNSTFGGVRSGEGSSIFDIRLKNAIAYISPNFSGFQVVAGYFANENKSDAVATKVDTSAYDLGLTYSNGPIWAGLTHADIQVRNQYPVAPAGVGALNTAGLDNIRTKETRLGGKYDFGNASVRLMVAQNKLTIDTFNEQKQTVWGLGGTFNVTANGKITGQYYRANDVKGTGFVSNGSDTGAKFFSLGYEHSLSKRTMLNAAYAHLKSDSNAWGYDFANATGLGDSDIKLSSFSVGLRHSF